MSLSDSSEGVAWDQQPGFNIFAMLQIKEKHMKDFGYETKEQFYEALDKEFAKLLEQDPNFSFETSAIGGMGDMPASMSFAMVLLIAPLDNFKYVIDKGYLKKESWLWLLHYLINSSMSPNFGGDVLDSPTEYLIDKLIEDKKYEDLKSFKVYTKEFDMIKMIMEESNCDLNDAVDEFCQMLPPESIHKYQILKQGNISLVKFIEDIYVQNDFYYSVLKKLKDIGCE